jgi:hypothetical protein
MKINSFLMNDFQGIHSFCEITITIVDTNKNGYLFILLDLHLLLFSSNLQVVRYKLSNQQFAIFIARLFYAINTHNFKK